MKFISWNVNGLRASVKKNFYEFFNQADADFFLVQETRVQPDEIKLQIPSDYYQYWDSAERPGYSGTAIFTKKQPLGVYHGVNGDGVDVQGRVITLEYDNFFLVNAYVPFSGERLQDLDARLAWDQIFIKYLDKLKAKKPVILGGGLSVAYEDTDVFDPDEEHHKAGFTNQERADFGELLASGFVDTFRELHPDETGAYTWWSYREHARDDNHGWRMDYFLVSDSIANDVVSSTILNDVLGSDHAPIELVMKDFQ